MTTSNDDLVILNELLDRQVIAAVCRKTLSLNDVTKEIKNFGQANNIDWSPLRPLNSTSKYLRDLVKNCVERYKLFPIKNGGDHKSTNYQQHRKQAIEAAIALGLSRCERNNNTSSNDVIDECIREINGIATTTNESENSVLREFVRIKVYERFGNFQTETISSQEIEEVNNRFRSVFIDRSTTTCETSGRSIHGNEQHGMLTTTIQQYIQSPGKSSANEQFVLSVYKMDREEHRKLTLASQEIQAGIKKQEIAIKSQKISARVQIAQINGDTEKAKAEANARIYEAKVELLRLRKAAAPSEPPPREPKRRRTITESLAEVVRAPWRNARCLTAAVWDARPADHPEPVEAVSERVAVWIAATRPNIKPMFRLLHDHPEVRIVYVGASHDLTDLVDAFWNPPPSAALPPSPLPPPTVAAVAVVPKPTQTGSPDDLVARLIPYFRNEANDDPRRALTTVLRDGFVKPLSKRGWAVLFPLPERATTILTHIEWDADPVAARLRDWVAAGAAPGAAPVDYPYRDGDARPPELVPDELRDLTYYDVLPLLYDAGLKRFCDKSPYHTAYTAAMACASTEDDDVSVARAPRHDETLRQWRRLTKGDAFVEFKDIHRCLGWTETVHDFHIVRAIVHALQFPARRLHEWHDGRSKPQRWCPTKCLWALRVACVYVARLKRGDADLAYAALDAKRLLPTPVAEDL